MKRLSFYMLYMPIILCISCTNTNPPQQEGEPVPESQLALILFPQEQLDYVFVSPIVDSVVIDYNTNINTLYYLDGLVLCNPTYDDSIFTEFAQKQWSLAGTNPYVILDNGYALVDWKWSHFHPLSGSPRSVLYWNPEIYVNMATQPGYTTNSYYMNGTLENEEYYLLSIKWQELTNLGIIWNMSEGTKIDKPEVRYVNLKDVEQYGINHNNPNDIDKNYNTTAGDIRCVYNLYLRDSTLLEDFVAKWDKQQAIYVETLNQMIKNKDFEKWTQYRK